MDFKGLNNEYIVLKDRIISHLDSVMSTGSFILGKEVAELEILLADYVGVKKCISCGNATDALILALMAIDLKKDDVVFVPDFSYIATASCVALLGGTPAFVDIDIDTYNISYESLENAIVAAKSKGFNCKAIITVDLFGQPADYEEIRRIADKYGLVIIEDGAQGFGGSIKNKKACSFGDISVTSFFPVKPLGAYGDGGALFCNDEKTYEKIWSLRSHGRTFEDKYDNVMVGFNSRLDTLQAAILLEKFDLFSTFELGKADEIAGVYSQELADFVKVPIIRQGYKSAWAQYTIALKSTEERGLLRDFLKERGIPSIIYYPKPLNEQRAMSSSVGLVDLSNGKRASETVLSLPIHAFMSDNDINQVIDGIRSYYKK